jgi:hypothetical protein
MQATKVALTPPPTHSPEGLAFNPADGMLYGVADIDVTTAMGLYRYDVLGSGAVTFVTALPPMGGGGDFDGLAIGNGRAYLIPDSHYSIAIWDFATQSYLPTPLPGAFVLEGYVCGGDWAPSLTLPNAPRIYCEGKVNSQNCHPLLGWKGLPSASAATTFEVIAAHMRPSVSCGLFYSLTGPANTPFGNGTLCLASPVLRTLTTTTITSTLQSCVGAATFDFNAFIASGANPSLVAGQTVWMQCLSRDPGFTPINGLGFSPALRATIQP